VEVKDPGKKLKEPSLDRLGFFTLPFSFLPKKKIIAFLKPNRGRISVSVENLRFFV
jgi:hypothetical protein